MGFGIARRSRSGGTHDDELALGVDVALEGGVAVAGLDLLLLLDQDAVAEGERALKGCGDECREPAVAIETHLHLAAIGGGLFELLTLVELGVDVLKSVVELDSDSCRRSGTHLEA